MHSPAYKKSKYLQKEILLVNISSRLLDTGGLVLITKKSTLQTLLEIFYGQLKVNSKKT